MRRIILPLAAAIALIWVLTAFQLANSHKATPVTTADLVFRSFDIPEPSPTIIPGMHEYEAPLVLIPIPLPGPTATPWPTHPPKPKLAGGPYKPWRVFNANVLAARAYLKSVLSATSFRCIDVLFDRESRWRVHAENRSSGAYGIPQALPGRKMAKFGADWRDNAITQVRWGLYYIRSRYGNPCIALDHSYRFHWY